MSTPERQIESPPDADVTPDGVTRRSTLKWMALAWVGFAAATAAGLTATVRFMFPNVLFEPPTRFKAGDPVDLRPGRGRALEGEVRRLDRPQHRHRSTRSWPSARTSAARRTGCRRRTSSSAPATAAATTCAASTSKARRRVRSSAPRSRSRRRRPDRRRQGDAVPLRAGPVDRRRRRSSS